MLRKIIMLIVSNLLIDAAQVQLQKNNVLDEFVTPIKPLQAIIAAYLGTMMHEQFLAKEHITSCAQSVDGKYLAVANGSKEVQIFDTQTKTLVGALQGPGYVRMVAFSPNGTHLATDCCEHAPSCKYQGADKHNAFHGILLYLWGMHENQQNKVKHARAGGCMQAPDGQLYLINCVDGFELDNSNGLDSLQFSPTSENVVCVTRLMTRPVLVELKKNKISEITDHGKLLFASSVHFTHTGNNIIAVTGSFGPASLQVFDSWALRQKQTRSFDDQPEMKFSAQSPDGKYIATADKNWVKLRAVTDFSVRYEYESPDAIKFIAFAHQGIKLFIVTSKGIMIGTPTEMALST